MASRRLVDTYHKRLFSASTDEGMTRVGAPLLSVFLGEGELNRRDVVLEVYGKCWGDASRLLQCLTWEELAGATDEERAAAVTAALASMLESRELFPDGRTNASSDAYVAYYLDLTDARFDDFFACVRLDPTIHSMVQVKKVVFVLLKLFDGKGGEYRERFDRLYDWAAGSGVRLVCMSDIARSSVLRGEWHEENCRACADLMLLIASETDGASLAGTVRECLGSSTCFSMAYASEGKDTKAIAAQIFVSLLDGLASYDKNKGEADAELVALLGYASNGELVGEVARRAVATLAPELRRTPSVLPYTEELAALDRACSGFGGLFRRGRASHAELDDLTEQAVRSLEACDVWQAYYDDYYRAPVEAWFDGGAADDMARAFIKRLSASLSVASLKGRLPREIGRLEALDADGWLYAADGLLPADRSTRAGCIAGYAENLVRVDVVGPRVKDCVQTALEQLNKDVAGFDRMVGDVRRELGRTVVPPAIERSYGAYCRTIVSENRDRLYKDVCPCDEEEFRAKLGELFEDVLNIDDVRGRAGEGPVFSQSIQSDIQFQTDATEGSIGDVIRNFFQTPLTARVPTFSALQNVDRGLFSLFGSDVRDLVSRGDLGSEVGHVFGAPWNDRIERIAVHPIEPSDIKWT